MPLLVRHQNLQSKVAPNLKGGYLANGRLRNINRVSMHIQLTVYEDGLHFSSQRG